MNSHAGVEDEVAPKKEAGSRKRELGRELRR
jgi:hypothetical protein